MRRKGSYRRVQLISYDAFKKSFWRLPSNDPNPTPIKQQLYQNQRKYLPRKIYLLPLE